MPDQLLFDAVALGETMLRLSVTLGERLQQAQSLDLHVGGAESNVLAALARLGRRSAWISSLPANALGRLVADALRSAGIDLSLLDWQPEGRVGTYYIEYGQGPRATTVLYDRQHSCLSTLDTAAVDWERALSTRLLHLTGITPALSPQARALTARACDEARARSVPFTFDVNFRSRLWAAEEAAAVLPGMASGAAILFCAERDAETLWGLGGEAEARCRALQAAFGAGAVVMTVGDRGSYLWDGSGLRHQPAYPTHVVDRIGAGDALAAGVIDGWLAGDLERGLQEGALLAALAASQHGDMVVTTADEVSALLAAPAGGLLR